jgi:hypothetical protein
VSEKEEREKHQRLLDLFEGAKGRLPKTDQELDEWLASAEGKARQYLKSRPFPAGAKRDGHNGGDHPKSPPNSHCGFILSRENSA